MRLRLCRNATVVLTIISFGLAVALITNALKTPAAAMPRQSYSEPSHWKYAASIDGSTVHAKGCPGLPKQDPHKMNLAYFNSLAEAAKQKKTDLCSYCIKERSASIPSTPTMTPSANIAQGKK